MGEMEVFHVGGRKRPKREKEPVRQKFQLRLFNYFSAPVFFLFISFPFFKLESQQAAKMTFAFEAMSV